MGSRFESEVVGSKGASIWYDSKSMIEFLQVFAHGTKFNADATLLPTLMWTAQKNVDDIGELAIDGGDDALEALSVRHLRRV